MNRSIRFIATLLGLALMTYGTASGASIEELLKTTPSWEADRRPISEGAINRFLSNFHHLALRPYYLEGVHVGYAIDLPENSPVRAEFLNGVGLREGDILLQINGAGLRSVMNLQTALDVLTRAFYIQIILLRNGVREVLNYEIH